MHRYAIKYRPGIYLELETHLNIDYARDTFDIETNLIKVSRRLKSRLPEYYTTDGERAWVTDVPLKLLPRIPMGQLK